MSDEPGLPATDAEKAVLMLRLVKAALQSDTPRGRADVQAVLREIQAGDPEAVARLSANLRLRGVGPARSTAH